MELLLKQWSQLKGRITTDYEVLEEFIVWYAVVKCSAEEEGDPPTLGVILKTQYK